MIKRKVHFLAAGATLAVLLSAGVSGQQSANDDLAHGPAEVIDDARGLLKRGMLGDAERRLSELSQSAPAAVRATAQLLAGNIYFERGQYALAEQRYGNAESLYLAEGLSSESVSSGLLAVHANQGSVRDALSRRQLLAHFSTNLQRIAFIIATASFTVVILLGRLLR